MEKRALPQEDIGERQNDKKQNKRDETLTNKQTTLFENRLWGNQMPAERIETNRHNQNSNNKQIYDADINNRPGNVIRLGVKNVHGFPDKGDHVKYDTLQEESAEHGHRYNVQTYNHLWR